MKEGRKERKKPITPAYLQKIDIYVEIHNGGIENLPKKQGIRDRLKDVQAVLESWWDLAERQLFHSPADYCVKRHLPNRQSPVLQLGWALWRVWGMRRIRVFVSQVGNYSSKQHHNTNHFKITYYLLQLFLWWPLWCHLKTSALWKQKPHSFSKLSAFLSPGELPFPQLCLISGFLAPHQRRKGSVWGEPPPIHNVNT